MQKFPMTEDTAIRTVKDADIPAPPPNLLAQLRMEPRSTRSLWALPAAATITAAIAATTIVGLGLRPTPSLAAVVRALRAQSQYTVKTTLKQPGGRTVTRYRNGALWRSAYGFGSADRTVVFDPRNRFVLIDSPREVAIGETFAESNIDRLLNPNLKIKVEYGVLWHGRKVDRYLAHGVDASGGEPQSINQEVIVDPSTNLPIQMTLKEGDNPTRIQDYDFSAPPASLFSVSIPPEMKTYDLVAQKRQIAADLAASKAVIVVDEDDQFYMLSPGAQDQSLFGPKIFQVDGLDEPLKLNALVLLSLAHESPTERYALPIGQKYWTVSRPNDDEGNLSWPKKILELQAIGGWLESARTTSQKGDTTIQLGDVPVIRTGRARFLIESFLNGRYSLEG